MSMITTYTCDHCGASCLGNIYASLWGDGDETKAYTHTRLDACSREHLGLALAKAFGLPIDTKAADLFVKHAKSEAHRVFLETEVKRLEARIAELERQDRDAFTPNPISMMVDSWANPQKEWDAANGKTPGQVNYAAFRDGVMNHHETDTVDKWEAAANAVLRAFGQPSQTAQDASDALRRVRVEFVRFAADARMPGPLGTQYTINEILAITLNIIDAQLAKIEPELEERRSDHVHEPQKRFKYERAWLSEQTDDALFDLYMKHVKFFDMNGTMTERNNMIETLAVIECDEPLPDTSTESGLPGAVLAAITLPTKPTKPLHDVIEEPAIECDECGQTGGSHALWCGT